MDGYDGNTGEGEIEGIKALQDESIADYTVNEENYEEQQAYLNICAEEAAIKQLTASTSSDPQEVDKRSIFVGNVDWSATTQELKNHFAGCGAINRVTILCDKMTGRPKGFAYVEFVDESSVSNGITLQGSILRGRLLKVMPKRTNIPAFFLKRGRPTRRPRVRTFPTYGHYPYHPYK
eukprot:TRINITY_DN140_c1_g2_i1.p1 TRINITY_DN140_c1_g2~~TRINITY_DN140_c1_g2_i1.p1  ORF type:complete len:178 (+),score=75.25 TRINITY_DN140_c1_g2_i1:46-579(+)